MPETWPRITIVTPSYGQGRYLEATIRSVVEQDYPDLEYFVVDGGSDDGTVEILRRWEDRLAGWVSEPDAGQSDAIAKGMRRATGEVVNWLNSDDLLLPGALRRIGAAVREGADVVVGRDRAFESGTGRVVRVFEPAGWAWPDCVTFWTGRFRYHQPPTFVRRELWERAGGIDPTLHYAMDYDLYCRILRLPDVAVRYLDEAVSAFRVHDASKSIAEKPAMLEEMARVSRRYWPDVPVPEGDLTAGLDRYVARCAVHHLAESVRGRDARGAIAALGRAARSAPLHAGRYALGRLAAGAGRGARG